MASVLDRLRGNVTRRETNVYLGGLLLVCFTVRVLLLLVYEPNTNPDSLEYRDLANQMLSGDFTNYTGFRTPGYPIFMMLFGLSFRAIWIGQSLIGLGTVALLFYLAYEVTRSPWAGVVLGGTYGLGLNNLFFEAAILTEALATFLLVLSLLLCKRLLDRPSSRVWWYVAGGTVTALAGLTRPLLLFLGALYLAFIGVQLLRRLGTPAERVRLAGAFVAPLVVLVGGWSLFNYATLGYFGASTLIGYNLTSHAGPFMELAPDEYREIRDIYVEERKKQVQAMGSHIFTIWRAVPRIRETTGLSYPDLSRKLTAMCTGLFVQYPGRYLASVSEAWWRFWDVRTAIDANLRIPSIEPYAAGIVNAWKAQWPVLTGINYLFFVVALYYTVTAAFGNGGRDTAFRLLAITTVFAASVSQALVEWADNARFAVPFEPLILFSVLVMFWEPLASKLPSWKGSATRPPAEPSRRATPKVALETGRRRATAGRPRR
ncbi:MAG: hypothetical protein HY329_14940 [Chloroflexi bacterium]|nr:hypothetical protein [Chloroflexota bacterium]